MLLVGIDPGFAGALAALDTQSGQLTVQDMPVTPNPKGKTELNLHILHMLLDPVNRSDVGVIMEKVSAMPKQGVTSMFRFGESYGALQMAIVSHRLPYQLITPRTWKKHFNLSSVKGSSRSLASQRFPNNAKEFSRVKDDGRAEAALIALYGAEVLTWTNSCSGTVHGRNP